MALGVTDGAHGLRRGSALSAACPKKCGRFCLWDVFSLMAVTSRPLPPSLRQGLFEIVHVRKFSIAFSSLNLLIENTGFG